MKVTPELPPYTQSYNGGGATDASITNASPSLPTDDQLFPSPSRSRWLPLSFALPVPHAWPQGVRSFTAHAAFDMFHITSMLYFVATTVMTRTPERQRRAGPSTTPARAGALAFHARPACPHALTISHPFPYIYCAPLQARCCPALRRPPGTRSPPRASARLQGRLHPQD